MSHGSYYTGEVLVNGHTLNSKDFGKVAAFVQQDDILMVSHTPRELLTFAAKIRTN
jgi:ABC-type multidrug transport system ATPase subunit